MSEKIIQISNVSFQYENSEKGALHDVSLTVELGECIYPQTILIIDDRRESGKCFPESTQPVFLPGHHK